MSIFLGVLLLVSVFVLVGILCYRTYQFKPYETKESIPPTVTLDQERILTNFIDIIRCRTVSNQDMSLIEAEEYERLYQILAERYPLVHEYCEPEFILPTGLLYTWKGRSSAAPTVCMAHYDVVPVDESGWTKPAFEGVIESDAIWGRGTLDTKATFCSILEATEQLIASGFVPTNDVYLSFSGDEEVDGASCPAIVAELERRGIHPALVLDEGGAVVENAFPGVTGECALIGIAEKGSLNVDFRIHRNGGHASTPPTHTIVGDLARAVTAIEKRPFSTQFTQPVLEMFDVLGRHSTWGYRMIFANLWLFKPILAWQCKKSGGELNAMLHTTCAFTRMEGGQNYNVLPPYASVGANLRLLGTDTLESALDYLEDSIKNSEIEVFPIRGMNPSIVSDTKCDAYDRLQQCIHNSWPDAIVAPYLMMACSDSRHYCRISDRVYRFSAMKLTAEERAMIHGNDERITIPNLMKTVSFYVDFLQHS